MGEPHPARLAAPLSTGPAGLIWNRVLANHVKVRPIASLCGVGVAPKAWAYSLWSTINGCSDW